MNAFLLHKAAFVSFSYCFLVNCYGNSKHLTLIIAGGKQIVKGIDAVTREQLVRIMSLLGIQNATPIFNMVPTIGPFKPAALIPTITKEDQVILNNVQKVLEFLTAGSSLSRTSNQVINNSLLKIICINVRFENFLQTNKYIIYLF